MITWTVNVVLGVYIGILVISTTTGHGGSVVSALASQAKASQAKGRGSNPRCDRSFFSHKYFLSPLSQPQSDQTDEPSICD